MPNYKPIPDTNVAAYWPINTPLLRKYRDNAQYVGHSIWCNGFNSQSLNVTEGTGADDNWTQVGTFEVLVPANYESPTGTKIKVRMELETQNDASATTSTTQIRLVAFGTNGDASTGLINGSPSNTVTDDITVEVSGTTVTAGTLHTISIETKCNVTGGGGVTTVTVEQDSSKSSELFADTG